MRKYFILIFPFLSLGCAVLMGKFNKSAYQKADMIIYEELFENKEIEIKDKDVIFDVVELLSKSNKVSEEFVPKEQLLFVRAKDTLVLYKNDTYLRDSKGIYSLTSRAEKRIMELLKVK